ncbi:MAG: hypothetical protein M1828_006454 [Chrysothrix sp. TS-e1954]|nr:MAG: hypothetical protein M1828_006454 [Chrysothrix sp. TS-e1954]
MAVAPEIQAAEAEWKKEPKSQTVPARRALVPIVQDRDTDARVSWRKRDQPKLVHYFPKEFAGPKNSSATRRSDRKGPTFQEIDDVANATETHITVSTTITNTKLFYAEIWGERALEAKNLIAEWIKTCLPDRVKRNNVQWAKIYSYTPEERLDVENRLRREALRQQYRRTPPEPASSFAAKGHVWWPDEFAETMEEILGRSFEALDSIRIGCKCYIVWSSLNRTFYILGDKDEHVYKATLRVRGVFYQVVARKREPEILFTVQPIDGNPQKTQIRLVRKDEDASNPYKTPMAVPKLIGGTPLAVEHVKPEKLLDFHGWEETILRALDTLVHYKGHLRMRARLGKLLLTKYHKKNELPFSDYVSMMAAEQVRGMVTPEVGDSDAEQAIHHRIAGGSKVLKPVDTLGVTEGHHPTFTCVVVVELPGGRFYRLEASYAHDFEGEYTCKSKVWLKLDKEGQLSQILDTTLIDLQKDSAWSLDIVAGYAVETNVPDVLQKFADSVKLKSNAVELSHRTNDQFFHYGFFLGMVMVSYEQKAVLTYDFVEGPYTCEAAKTRTFLPRKSAGRRPDQSNLEVGDPHASLHVFHRQWDAILAENANLGAGKQISWTPELGTFFPEEDIATTNMPKRPKVGLAGFVERLEEVEDIVRGSPYYVNCVAPQTEDESINGHASQKASFGKMINGAASQMTAKGVNGHIPLMASADRHVNGATAGPIAKAVNGHTSPKKAPTGKHKINGVTSQPVAKSTDRASPHKASAGKQANVVTGDLIDLSDDPPYDQSPQAKAKPFKGKGKGRAID